MEANDSMKIIKAYCLTIRECKAAYRRLFEETYHFFPTTEEAEQYTVAHPPNTSQKYSIAPTYLLENNGLRFVLKVADGTLHF